MFRKLFLAAVALSLITLFTPAASAMGSGTAWGVQIGAPVCIGTGTAHKCYLTLHLDGNPNGDLTMVKCTTAGNMDTWCAAILNQETVILSFYTTPVLCEFTGLVSNELVPDGVTKTHYCYPGPCGS